ncbi:chaperonin 10-like protein [Dactylonectria estremocensis]|uniref:Chaperonin 10-like protein n=1 Tax=Dactylonectria estremocensis TaxID=1079267 RepID=A0A9P9JBW8_9HYPO|nr:chaperonin 10-like protein [Dactylonectria estremocensis]
MVSLPTEMKALRYEKPEDFSIVTVPLPEMRDNDVLVKVKACGHIHEGEFIAKFPLIPGHETVGVVAAVGKDVKGFAIGDRVAADNSELCNECFYCRRGQPLLCENFNAHGVTMNGGFAEYCAYPAAKVFKIHNLSWVDATLLEPASCACHGLEKIRPKLGSHVLMFGAGPTGLMLAQLLRQNGGCKVTIAAPGGLKMELAKSLEAADEYIELSRSDPAKQFAQLRAENPYGFDIVVEATGSVGILEDSINYVRRGGTLVVYGVYSNADRVSWPPSKIFGDEITILGSFSETYMFPATIDYLDSGKVKTAGIVNKTFKLEDFGEALQSIKDKSAIKAAIVFDDEPSAPEAETNGASVSEAATNGVSLPEESTNGISTPQEKVEEKAEVAPAPEIKVEEKVEDKAEETIEEKIEEKIEEPAVPEAKVEEKPEEKPEAEVEEPAAPEAKVEEKVTEKTE